MRIKEKTNRHTEEDTSTTNDPKGKKYLRLLEELIHEAELHHTPVPRQVHIVMLDTARKPPYLNTNSTQTYTSIANAIDGPVYTYYSIYMHTHMFLLFYMDTDV